METNKKIKSYEPENFEENYKAYLVGLLSTDYKCCGTSKEIEIEKNKAWKKLREKKIAYYNIYMDPDKKESIDFYNDLSDFLNAASCEHRKDLLFKANGLSKKGIMVYRKKDKKEYFTIQSDQLGFSAVPWIYFSTKYPLSRYFEMQKNEEAAKFLTDYVLATRTLGGSFLWPESWHKDYNRERGIKNYLEDRVDLTLLEIKHYFEYRDLDDKKKFKYRRDLLFSRYKIPDAQTWFGFFDSFEDYVDFFLFNDFVKATVTDGKKEYMPINILNGEPFEKDYLNYEEDVLKGLEEYKLKAMLDLVMDKVANRTKKMEDLINEYNQTNDTKGEKHENILHE